MTALAGRRIIVGVCGSISAYKAVEVVRRLVDAGAHVIPVLTESAEKFVGTMTFSALASWSYPQPPGLSARTRTASPPTCLRTS
jgi:phosphopantothenoylcysteine synthetase/decarboxylase